MHKTESDQGVNIFGYLNGGFGLAMAAKYFIRAIDGKIPYALKNVNNTFQISEFCDHNDTPLSYQVNIYFINADEIKGVRNSNLKYTRNVYEIGVWFWELEEFPDYLQSSFEVLDEIWTCSDYIYQSLKKISPIPVFLMPFPWFPPDKPINKKTTNEGSFEFLTVFDYRSDFSRKNPLAAIKAFSLAFQNDENVSLTIKSINHEEFPALHQELKNEIKKDKRIKLIDDRISREAMNKLFDESDCFVSLHRAEGLGLNILDAASQNKPLIVTPYGGCMDFINDEYCELVDFQKIPVKSNTEFLNVEESFWADPDIKSAAGSMQKIFNNPLEYTLKAAAQKKYQEEKLNPSLTFNWVDNRLSEISNLQSSQKKSFLLPDVLQSFLPLDKDIEILLTGTAPVIRTKEVLKCISGLSESLKIDYFGREIDLKFSGKYIYPHQGTFTLADTPENIIQDMKSRKYNIVVVLLMNYYGYNYENIKEIVKSLNPGKIIALGKENDIFFW